MSVRSRDIPAEGRVATSRQAQRIGFLSGRSAEGCFVWLLRLAGLLLIAVSIVGTGVGNDSLILPP